ncbi:ParE toxin of type II toxin-antitoxin system, parDE [Solimonas aquatica]|uniref:ParE toxin of type II toxin-antitoxin system, parDE n=1 Tax=Solimonas aquatica TaxID=489703 RepID=A0A1H9HF14_9GAMM|nr:ParE toxin of type II toxin-antitoxin system, parDE [Solimonas aquatica]
MLRRLLLRSSKLAEQPLSGRRIPEYPESALREVLERPFRLIYRIIAEQQQIDIVTVKHYRQRLPPRPEQLG